MQIGGRMGDYWNAFEFKELSKEEILELGKQRPFYKFVSFPIEINEELFGCKSHLLSITLKNEDKIIYTCGECKLQIEEKNNEKS